LFVEIVAGLTYKYGTPEDNIACRVAFVLEHEANGETGGLLAR
jgi:hypothetical protein